MNNNVTVANKTIGQVHMPPAGNIGGGIGGGIDYGLGFDYGTPTGKWPIVVPEPFEPHTRREWLIGQALCGGAGMQAKEIADQIERELVKEEQAADVVDALEEMP